MGPLIEAVSPTRLFSAKKKNSRFMIFFEEFSQPGDDKMCHERRSESHNTLRGTAAAAAAADLHFSKRLEFCVCVAEELKNRISPNWKKTNQGNVERVGQIAASLRGRLLPKDPPLTFGTSACTDNCLEKKDRRSRVEASPPLHEPHYGPSDIMWLSRTRVFSWL